MVRRWSRLNDLNINFEIIAFNNFNKIVKLTNFKNTIFYKKFTCKITKLKRKSLIRIKHKTNWLIYVNVIKLWVNEYVFSKHHLKMQFYNKIFINNFFFYNPRIIRNKNEIFFYNYNFIFTLWTKKSYRYFFNRYDPNFIKNISLTIGWLWKSLPEESKLVTYNQLWDNLTYAEVENSSRNFLEKDFFVATFDSLMNSTLKQIVEIRKILNFFFYYNVFKI